MNDSGWVSLEIDGQDASEQPHTDILVSKMYDELDYGSWAGEFSASGEATYDPKTKSFVGIDHYSEDDRLAHSCKIKLTLPDSIWFDSLEIQIEDEGTIESAFIIKNGFLTEEHEEALEALNQKLRTDVNEEIDEFVKSNPDIEYREVWQNIRINYDEFIHKGDVREYIMKFIDIGTYNTTNNDIYLDLKDLFDESED